MNIAVINATSFLDLIMYFLPFIKYYVGAKTHFTNRPDKALYAGRFVKQAHHIFLAYYYYTSFRFLFQLNYKNFTT